MVTAAATRSVGRPREFNEVAVLEAAMEAFWNKGFEATSLADLCAATGLHKGSLYQSFGDKHQLFMRALQHYSEKEFAETMQVVDPDGSPLQNIRNVVKHVSDTTEGCKGCMVVNSMVELGPHDEQVKAAVNAFGELRLQAMAEMITAAQATGEIRAELDPASLAQQLMVTIAGVAATSKSFIDAKDAAVILDRTIDLWL